MKSDVVCLLGLALAACSPFSPAQSSAPKQPTVYVVPFSHLDLYWGGTQEECLSRGNRIISRTMQLLQEHPDFRFLLEDDVFVANFMDSHRGTPEADMLRRLVREGRIEIAPKWAAIYQNLPRAEALARNLTYGKRYARDVFGVDPLVAHLGDIPGFTRQYPQLLRESSIPYMVMTRMGPPQSPLFHWKAPDGSSVLLWDTLRGYGWGVGLGLHRDLNETTLTRIRKEVDEIQSFTKGPVYLGWGTDLFAPNKTLVSNLGVLNSKLAPTHFQFATPTEYFHAAEKTADIPDIAGEIPSSWANVISSLTPAWPPAITATDTLVSAEKFAAINDALGLAPYPQQQLDGLWRKSLEALDHNNYGQGGDIGDDRKLGYAQAAMLQGGQILRDSLRNIAERVQHHSTKGTALVVFNPLAWTRTDTVRAHVTVFGDVAPGDIPDYRKALRVVDNHGNAVPFDIEEYTENMSRALTVVFSATDVPSLGYKTFYVEPTDAPITAQPATSVTMDSDLDAKSPRRIPGNDVLENRYYRVTVDRATGRIELFDKDLNRTVAKDLEISATEERGGNSLSVEPRTGRTLVNLVRSVELIRNGNTETVMEISGAVGGVPIKQKLTLFHDLKRLDLENAIDWTPGHFMKIQQVFPLDMPGAEIRNGVPFGSAAEADIMSGSGPRSGDEVPAAIWKGWRQIQDWITASTPEWNLTISADHQMFIVDVSGIHGDMIRGTRFNPLKTMREIEENGSVQAREVRIEQPPAATYTYRYSITSSAGNWAAAHAWRTGMAFNTPLIAVVSEDELSPKTLPDQQSFLELKGDNLAVTAVKKADRGNGIIVRFYEATGQSVSTPVTFLGHERNVRPVNLLEERGKLPEGPTVAVRPYGIETIEIPAAATPRSSRK